MVKFSSLVYCASLWLIIYKLLVRNQQKYYIVKFHIERKTESLGMYLNVILVM